MKIKLLAAFFLSISLILGACSNNEEIVEEKPINEDNLSSSEPEENGQNDLLEPEEPSIIDEITFFGREVAVLYEKGFFNIDFEGTKETKATLSKYIKNEEALEVSMNFIRFYREKNYDYIVKEIRYNEESEKVYEKSPFYYYQVTFEAEVKDGVRPKQIDDTLSLQIGIDENGEFYVNDFIHMEGHTVPGAGPYLVDESFTEYGQELVEKLIKYAYGFEEKDYYLAVDGIKDMFTHEGDALSVLDQDSFKPGVDRTFRKFLFYKSYIETAFVSKEFKKEHLKGQNLWQIVGEIGVLYDEKGKTGDQGKGIEFKLYLYQPDAENGNYEFELWKFESNEYDEFDLKYVDY